MALSCNLLRAAAVAGAPQEELVVVSEEEDRERWRWSWLTGCDWNSVKSQMVNIPSFLVRVEQEKHIEFALTSPYGPGRPGRVKRKMMAAGGGGGDADDE